MTFALPWYDDRELLGDDYEPTGTPFTAQCYELCHLLGVSDNYEAETLVAASIADTELIGRVEFDSEHGCFFAHTAERSDMEALAAHIEALVAERTETPKAQTASGLDGGDGPASAAGTFENFETTGSQLTETDKIERAQHHFARRDYWEFTTRNAEAQIKALAWFRDAGCGFPGKPGAETPEAWNQRLAEMIDGWQAVLDRDAWDEDWSNERIADHIAACETRFQVAMAVYTTWYFSLWD